MEVIRQLRVVTSERKCVFKEKSQFHMNLPGFSLPVNERQLYLNVDNFWIPKKKKRVSFSMYFRRGVKDYCSVSQLKKFDLTYYSMEDFAVQMNCLVWNNFCGKAHTCTTDVAGGCDRVLGKGANGGEAGEPGEAGVGEAGAGAGEAVVGAGGEAVAGVGEAGAGAGEAVVGAGGEAVAGEDLETSGTGDGKSMGVVGDDLELVKKKMAGRPYHSHVDCSRSFLLKYENDRFVLNMYRGSVFVVSANIGKLMNFDSDDSWDPDPMKLCNKYNVGSPCYFLDEHEQTCHLVMKNLVDSSFYNSGGGSYGILCSFDAVSMKMTPFLKKLACKHVHDLHFYLVDDNNGSYFVEDELVNNAVRFTLNFLKHF